MGRTMAGKSSLLAALSGSNFDRVGDGRQRYSRDVFVATPTASIDVEIVDTPGVGAHDGAEDVELAFEAARDADLILWVASSDSIQEDTASSLRELGLIGKPIVIVMNGRQSLEGVGRRTLLTFPDRVFGNREGLVDEIRRRLAPSGVGPLDVVYVHALAASQARGDRPDAALHEASRIDHLTQALNREHASHSGSRRALKLIDGQRLSVDRLTLALAQGSMALRARAEQDRIKNEDMRSRLTRIVRAAGEAMTSDVSIVVARHREWHLEVTGFGKSLPQDWEDELNALQGDLKELLEVSFARLKVDLDSTLTAAETEWASVSVDRFSLQGLTGFDSVLGNRLARVGVAGLSVGGGMAGLWAGAQIGGLLGLPSGPGAIVTAAVGGLIGLGVGMALNPLKALIDSAIVGKDGVLRKRRAELGRQVGTRLDEFTIKYEESVEEQLAAVLAGVADEQALSEDRSTDLDVLARQWEEGRARLRALIEDLDTATAAALLRIAGRERLARSLKRSTRVPGVCILAEFDEAAFWEAWLFPPDLGENLAGGRASCGGAAANSLSYALGLLEEPIDLVSADASSALLRVHKVLPPEIADTWADALTSHIGKRISIDRVQWAA